MPSGAAGAVHVSLASETPAPAATVKLPGAAAEPVSSSVMVMVVAGYTSLSPILTSMVKVSSPSTTLSCTVSMLTDVRFGNLPRSDHGLDCSAR